MDDRDDIPPAAEMSRRVRIDTQIFNDGTIKQRLHDDLDNAHRGYIENVLRTRAVRKALVELGWTQPGGGWTRIQDGMPVDGSRVLVRIFEPDMGLDVVCEALLYGSRWSTRIGGHQRLHVTHWMPMPSLPGVDHG